MSVPFATLGTMQSQLETDKAVDASRSCDHTDAPSPTDVRADLSTSTTESAVAELWKHRGGALPAVERPPRTDSSGSLDSCLLDATPSLVASSVMETPTEVAKRGPPYAPALETRPFLPCQFRRSTQRAPSLFGIAS